MKKLNTANMVITLDLIDQQYAGFPQQASVVLCSRDEVSNPRQGLWILYETYATIIPKKGVGNQQWATKAAT